MNDELKNNSSLATGVSESHNTEFKSTWHDDYLKWVCGFANAIGGTIYISKEAL